VPLPLESVPNISEGRDVAALAALREAFSGPARLLDVHADVDHHRSVFTLVGTGDELVETLVAGIRCAAERIDLRRHSGAHPRIGAADVVPLVPLSPAEEGDAREAALVLADRVAGELHLPVFFYGRLTDDLREPAFFRRGGPEELQRRIEAGELRPDRGPEVLHPTAGGVLVGVRRPLVAFNVNLRSDDVEAAREIARLVRERDGGFKGVRALHEIVRRIVAESEARGIELAGSELVGLMPAGAAIEAAGSVLRIEGFDSSRVLELRLLDN
jgi:glutamate formiminotransferase